MVIDSPINGSARIHLGGGQASKGQGHNMILFKCTVLSHTDLYVPIVWSGGRQGERESEPDRVFLVENRC